MSQVRANAPAPVRVVFDGQSMNVSPEYPNNSPYFAMFGKNIPWANIAIGGNGWYDLSSQITPRLSSQARNRAGCTDILIMNGGQGDVLNAPPSGGNDAATCYQRAIDYADVARGLGFHKIILVTWPAWGPDILFSGGRPTATENEYKADFNALALANTGDFDAVVDCHTPAPFTDGHDLTYFAIDRLHLSKTGAKIMGELIWEKIEEVIASL